MVNKKILYILIAFIIILIVLNCLGLFYFDEKYSLTTPFYNLSNTKIVLFFSLIFSLLLSFLYKEIILIFRLLILILIFSVVYFISIVFLNNFYRNIDKCLAVNLSIVERIKYYDHNDPIIRFKLESGETIYFYQKTVLGDVEIPDNEIHKIKIVKSIFDPQIKYYYFK